MLKNSDAWKTSVAAAEGPDGVLFNARLALGTGIVHVLKAIAEERRAGMFDEMMSETISRLEEGRKHDLNTKDPLSKAILALLADELRLLSGLARAFSDTGIQGEDAMESDDTTSQQIPVPDHVLGIVRQGWPFVVHAAANLSDNEVCTAGDVPVVYLSR